MVDVRAGEAGRLSESAAGAISLASQREAIFTPTDATVAASQLTEFMRFCETETGRVFGDQAAFYDFSVSEFRDFWLLFLRWSQTIYEGSVEPVCTDDVCERASFFPDVRLSYAENVLRVGAESDSRPAITALHGADASPERLDRGQLRRQVASFALALRGLGVEPGEHVVGILHNNAEAVIAGLAVTALGATFSTAPTDMGAFGILSRFEQLSPAVLIANLDDSGQLGSAALSHRVEEVVRGLPSVKTLITADDGPIPAIPALEVLILAGLIEARPDHERFEWPRFPFNHPLFILFSSGTTGKPKCIVHGAGGTLLEHLKEHRLHGNLRTGDKLLFHTSTAWMMWNWQLTALACGAEILVYDGAVAGPETLWRLVAKERVTVFGTSPPYLRLCRESAFSPRRELSLDALRAVQSTGSILPDSEYDWHSENVGQIPLQSISGGTDIVGCFVLGSPNLPVYRGESQCRSLGLDVRALSYPDAPVGSTNGELVCCNPFPSRPLGLHGDQDGSRFHTAYFAENAGVWTHGDRIAITAEGSCRLFGRSDSVLNVGGVRIGPSEIYAVVLRIPEIRDVMAVERHALTPDEQSRIVLLVVLHQPGSLDELLRARLRETLARDLGPAYVPATIIELGDLPTTHSNKRSERAARDAVNGVAVENVEALRNPECLETIRRELGDAQRTSSERVVPSDPLETVIIDIWEELLGLSPVRPEDNFFDLGGTSILAVRLVQELDRRLGCELPVAELFNAPTVSRLAGMLRASSGQGASLQAYLPPRRRRPWQAAGIRFFGLLLAAPMIGLYRARILAYPTAGQILALLPGRLGLLIRLGWYRATLESCGEDLSIEFGSVIHKPSSRIGHHCAIGPHCWIGWVDVGDDVMIGSHVVILSGGRAHGIADLSRPMRSQPGVLERVRIGSDVWLGARATIMVDVAEHSIVSAGSSVSASFEPYAVISGAPGRVTGSRLPAATPRSQAPAPTA